MVVFELDLRVVSLFSGLTGTSIIAAITVDSVAVVLDVVVGEVTVFVVALVFVITVGKVVGLVDFVD
jgi:hypothetical protein